MHIAFLTGHRAGSKRKTGFHFWADIAEKKGHYVSWVTLGQSRLSYLKQSVPKPGIHNQWDQITNHIRTYNWVPAIHPVNMGPFNSVAAPLFPLLYPALMPDSMIGGLQTADVIIVETGAGLVLVPKLARYLPNAKFIYYCSDRMDTLGAHPAIIAAEKKALPFFSLVRVNAEARLADFPSHKNVRYIPQGIDKDLFDRDYPNPYQTERNIISVGDMLFDKKSVTIMAQAMPDWNFHLFGKGAKLDQPLSNVFEYGECAYDAIIPYLKFADIGLAPYRPDGGHDYLFQSSLKITQYLYCRLPVIAPDFMPDAPYMMKYNTSNPQTMVKAITDAGHFDRSKINPSSIPDWDFVLDTMLENL